MNLYKIKNLHDGYVFIKALTEKEMLDQFYLTGDYEIIEIIN